MNLEELLQELTQKNIQLSIDGEKLRYRGAKEVLTPALLHQIRQYKAEILQLLGDRSNSPSYPLSHGQQGLWFLYQLAPESAAYNLAFTVRIRSHLNVPALQRACQKLILRHPMLRTTFGQRKDELLQKVHEYQEIHFEEINAATWDWNDLTKRVIAAHRLPFDLEKGPVLRVNLFTRSFRDYVFLLAIHHIAVDGFSYGILLDELRLLYQAEDFGQEISLPPINSQYQDFVRYQHQMLTTPVAEELWRYWQRQLAGNLPMLKLPSAKPLSSVQNNQAASYTFNLTTELTFRLREMARAEGVTLYTILLAAFVVLLHRYTNEEDILIGSPVNSRNRSEFDSVVGFFVNMLVLRVNLVGNPTFSAFLKQVRSIVLDALAHQDYPTHLLVERLQHKRNRHHWGLFQVSFNLLQLQQITEVIGLSMSSQAKAIADWGGLSLEPFEIPQQEGQNDVFLNMVETAESLFGTFRYDGDECMATHFQNLLSAIVENPQQAVGELPLLSAAERHQLLREWNNQPKEYPSDQCIHQLFESQVEKTPQAVAVVFEDEQLTYQELNQRANQLAHYLQSLGVKPEVLVGICVERSVDMVVGLLGILKAGGAYLPLDPNYPQERLSHILADAAVGVLLTQHSLLNSLPSHTTQVVCLDTDWEIISQQGEVNPVSETRTSNLAYIIYTSGSTGNPKGVQIPHYNVVRLFAATQSWFNFNESDVWTFFHSYAFDFSVWEIWGALLHGGRLIVVSYLTSRSLESFYKLLGEEKVTVLNQTPSAFSQLIQADKSLYKVADLRLRLVIFGGEALELQSLEPWFEQHGDQLPQLVNMYGITETTVHVTYRPLTIADINLKASIIGSPIPDLQVYILDQNLQPIPVGVGGELYVGGAALARGYLNRPELTAEKFIPNPFSDDKSARLYKTGDLARYLSDGNIEFLGRIDNQVKIRGFRIELGEIEAVINTHPQVQQAVVIAREDIPSNKHLVAYVVASDKSLTSNQVRELLKQKLPEYMIPSAFVILDNLPLTPNGKIDGKALPIPDRKIISGNEYVAPTTPSEKIIADIFTKVLGVQNVGIYDNFFELGGHSLLATQLVSQLRLAFNVEIPLITIFASPTVAQLNQTLIQLRNSGSGLSLPLIQPIKDREQLPLSWAQERLWFLNQLEGSSTTYNIPGVIRITGILDIDVLQQALVEIVCRHEILRTSFQTVSGKLVQVVHPEVTMNIKVVDLQQLLDTERETHLQQLAQQAAIIPFDLEIAPLIRCSLLLLSATEYVLLLTMHHIVSDGWSVGVFISELSALYQAFKIGEVSPLAPLAIQYADFTVWQRQWLSGSVLETQLNYWRSQLQGTPYLLQLPTDRPRPNLQTYKGNTQSFSLNTDLTQKLQILSRESGTTLFMTLYAAFATLLYRYSGESDILIGTPIANRTEREIESLIGFFVNTLVLRTQFADNPSFEQLIVQVRETTLQAYEHQDVPFEQVVEALQPQRSLSYSPLFQVMFVWQNAPMAELELPGVTLALSSTESTIAKFDLTVTMSKTKGGLVGSWEYNTDLFDGSTIERMVAHFQNLLLAIVQNPQQAVGELPLLSAAERHQLLVEWNNTATEYPTDKCIHKLFEEQVEQTPDAVAMVFADAVLTYRELNSRANQLAQYLQTLGVEPEVMVGIGVERSLDMVVGLLGILKAGGAYVPLDPTYPQERLEYMLNDAQVSLLLTQSQVDLGSPPIPVVYLDRDFGEFSQENVVSGAETNNLAYVIYTSGSTGKPKGVLVTHQGLCNLALSQIRLFNISANSRVLQFASLNFDASVSEIFMILCSGAMLVLGTPESLLPGANLIQLLNHHAITHVTLPPSVLTVLPTDDLPSLQNIIVAGEALSADLVEQWSCHRQIFNAYGPTESTVCATVGEINDSSHKPPIGRPIPNTQIYILDRYLQPVPIGVKGELHIGGVGLVRGYLNRPDLTEEKFIRNPFNNEASRLYKTGDLARYLSDGNIELFGRIDNQVKIRGFRIELGEIEVVLSQHHQVKEVVVMAREDQPGNKRLVAYIVPKTEQCSVAEIQGFLKQKLPDYMLPSAFVILDNLPLLPNGKINRQELLKIDIHPNVEAAYIAPQNETEEMIAAVWLELLQVEKVGVHDNFFELGGHSLLLVQVHQKLREIFAQKLSIVDLFKYPTVSYLAEYLSQESKEKPAVVLRQDRSETRMVRLTAINQQSIDQPIASPLVKIQLGTKPPFFCVHPIGGDVLCYVNLAQHLDPNQPFYGLQAAGLDGKQEPLADIKIIATHYIQALQTAQPQGPYFLGGWSMGGVIAWEMATQLQSQGQKVALLALIDAAVPTSMTELTEIDDTTLLSRFVQDILGLSSEYTDFSVERLEEQSPEQRLAYVMEQEQITNLPLRHLFHVFKTHFRAMQTYIPSVYADRVTLFKASEQLAQDYQDPTMGWGNMTNQAVEIHVIPGNHYSIMAKPHVKILAEQLMISLHQAQASQ